MIEPSKPAIRNGLGSNAARLAVVVAFAMPVVAFAQSAAGTAPATTSAKADDSDIIELDPFTVTTEKDYGYRASNSIAGTRTDTPIKDVPVNIQVFTKELSDDLIIKNQVDLEAYNASLVNGGADRLSDNVIQQSYQNFLFRGFRQNWGLRDGVREYDPIDTQVLSRVEVVKGPAAALYGLAYPGGVMQNISKTADFARNFVDTRITVGGEGDYRGTIDANFAGTLNGGKFGIRFNGVNEKTKDAREHSTGFTRVSSLNMVWKPTNTTTAELLIEQGSRGKPNGLGYFTVNPEFAGNPNQTSIPLQIAHPEIPWTTNWASGVNLDVLDTNMYREKITQRIGDNFQIQAYAQYSTRLETPGNGWDANGSGGANSWESASSGYNPATNLITSTYNYRDWGNKMHAYGATGVYKVDFGSVKNTFAFGANVWGEKELSRHSTPTNPLASAVIISAVEGADVSVPIYPPADLHPDMGSRDPVTGAVSGNGYHHENNSNDYYFINWQASMLDNKLKTNVGINHTKIKTVAWNAGASTVPDNVFIASKDSPMFGATYEITPEISVFGIHATSLFPDSTKDSFGKQFSPQVGSSYEGGFKFELSDNKLSGTVSYYQIKQTGGTQSDPNAPNTNTVKYASLSPADRAVQFPGGPPSLGDIVQGGEQQSKGFDVDLVYQPLRQWQIVFSFAHTNHEFTQSAIPSTIGETFPEAIKNRYSLLTKYSFSEGDLKGLDVGLGISGGSKRLIDYQNFGGVDVARYEPARMTAELFSAYHFKLGEHTAMIQLNVKNLTKASDYAGWKPTGSATILATERFKVPTPMVWRLTFGYDF